MTRRPLSVLRQLGLAVVVLVLTPLLPSSPALAEDALVASFAATTMDVCGDPNGKGSVSLALSVSYHYAARRSLLIFSVLVSLWQSTRLPHAILISFNFDSFQQLYLYLTKPCHTIPTCLSSLLESRTIRPAERVRAAPPVDSVSVLFVASMEPTRDHTTVPAAWLGGLQIQCPVQKHWPTTYLRVMIILFKV